MKLFYLCIYGWLQFNPHADPLDSWGSQHVSTWLAGSQQDFIRNSSAVEEGLNLLPPTTVKELLKVEISRKGKLPIQHSMEQVMGPACLQTSGTSNASKPWDTFPWDLLPFHLSQKSEISLTTGVKGHAANGLLMSREMGHDAITVRVLTHQDLGNRAQPGISREEHSRGKFPICYTGIGL